jgi:excisionase family DNA binding protein
MERPDLINAEEFAVELKCSPEQVEELARAGEIPGLKLGRGWLFVRSDALAFLAQRARDEAAERRAKAAGGNVRDLVRIKARRGRVAPALPVCG